jgi:hypothetical protein
MLLSEMVLNGICKYLFLFVGIHGNLGGFQSEVCSLGASQI